MAGLVTRVATIVLGCAVTTQAPAQLAFQETEPNETPETANRIDNDVRIFGPMAPGDQDGCLWTVSDVDAVKRWTFELQGTPGVLTAIASRNSAGRMFRPIGSYWKRSPAGWDAGGGSSRCHTGPGSCCQPCQRGCRVRRLPGIRLCGVTATMWCPRSALS